MEWRRKRGGKGGHQKGTKDVRQRQKHEVRRADRKITGSWKAVLPWPRIFDVMDGVDVAQRGVRKRSVSQKTPESARKTESRKKKQNEAGKSHAKKKYRSADGPQSGEKELRRRKGGP